MDTSTPLGTGMGSLPIRDIAQYLLVPWSPDVGEDFPTYALAVGLTVGEQSMGRGDDRHSEAAEHLGQVRRLRVHAEAGLADAAYAGDGALTVRAVLQSDGQRGADLALRGVLHPPGGDVALLLQDLGHTGLELARRHADLVVEGLVAVAHTREHVRDRIGHRHGRAFPFRFPAVARGRTWNVRWWITSCSW